MTASRPVRVPSFRMTPRREKRPWGWLVLSVVLHLAVILPLVIELSGPDTFTDVDTRTPGGEGPVGGGGGGGARVIAYVDLPAYVPPRREREEQQQPVDELVIPRIEVAPVEMPVEDLRFEVRRDTTPITSTVLGEGAGTGGGRGAGTGTGGGIGSGRGTGVGSGVGPGTGGEGGEIFAPAPRFTILPPLPRPNSVKGREFQFLFTVGPDGRVEDVKIRPEIRDADYRRRLMAQLYQWTFAPALTREGVPVRGEALVTLAL